MIKKVSPYLLILSVGSSNKYELIRDKILTISSYRDRIQKNNKIVGGVTSKAKSGKVFYRFYWLL